MIWFFQNFSVKVSETFKIMQTMLTTVNIVNDKSLFSFFALKVFSNCFKNITSAEKKEENCIMKLRKHQQLI